MKKIFVIAVLASIVFASCSKENTVTGPENVSQQEISISALSKAMTKSVVGRITMPNTRNIQVAGVMKTSDGKYVDFLSPTEFQAQEIASTPGTYNWKATTPVYYPIGGENADFRFLAYSETTPDASSTSDLKKATFARWYGSSQVELQVGEESARNEIIYSGFMGNKNAAAQAVFHRTQALITVAMKAKESDDDGKIIINKVGFKDVKTSGTLLLTIDPKKESDPIVPADADASHEWLFNAGCNCAFAEMGNYWLAETALHQGPNFNFSEVGEFKFTDHEVEPGDAYGALGEPLKYSSNFGPNENLILDRLFPAQEVEAATMVVNYTLGGKTRDVELDLSKASLSSGGTNNGNVKWEAGKRYVYTINVNVSKILINPNVPDAWAITTIEGTYDPES